jgi:hypothetical protein
MEISGAQVSQYCRSVLCVLSLSAVVMLCWLFSIDSHQCSVFITAILTVCLISVLHDIYNCTTRIYKSYKHLFLKTWSLFQYYMKFCKLKSEQPVSYHHKLIRSFCTYHLDLLIYQKCLDWHSICGVNISSDSCQLLLPVGVFILFMWPTQPIAHIQARVIVGSDERYLSDTIKSTLTV